MCLRDTPRQALVELTEGRVLQRVALAVLRERGYPRLRITSPRGDLDRDAYGRPWFGEHDDTVLLVSVEGGWSTKLDRDLKRYLARDTSATREGHLRRPAPTPPR
ncbi:hypothetical protein [Actinomycetospora chiangmaiensis]|uniref:hypothetical protein n=1 Tax=Actinomycetospora chiangmaiensis TaxID=402650 RepID=UPI0003611F1F|nr:hypothetical protein [Actinomycetospora chiangmaiensis]